MANLHHFFNMFHYNLGVKNGDITFPPPLGITPTSVLLKTKTKIKMSMSLAWHSLAPTYPRLY